MGGFSQAHAEVNRALVERVRRARADATGMRVLELYAGHGNFTRAAGARRAPSYTAVEQDAPAVRALRRNLAARELTAKVVEGDASRSSGADALDVVVLDPPRTGAPGVLTALLRAQAEAHRLRLVRSGDARARRRARCSSAATRCAQAEAFDMFPQTADLESVVLLERA